MSATLSIGWIIFWKCVVVGVWAGIAAKWAAFRKKRRENGIDLKKNRDGVYVASDWTQTVENGAIGLRGLVYAFVFIIWTAIGGAFVLGGRQGILDLASNAFTLLQ